ncbi:alpha/beta hydrolase family protein [Candidatus Hepatincolaceae symbiont of Richtersius coronifer]
MIKSPLDYIFIAANENLGAKSATAHPLNPCNNIIILLHGYGSDNNDLSSVASLFKQLPNTSFVCPNAPFPCNYMGYQWFALDFVEDEIGNIDIKVADFKALNKTNKILTDFIDYISNKYNVPYEKIGLFGFSQGGIMVLYHGLHSPNKFAGVVCHSGLYYEPYQFNSDIIKKPKSAYNDNQDILLIHGEKDRVVSFDHMKKTREFFAANNLKYESHFEKNLEHNINEITMAKSQEFFLKHF